MTEVPRAFELRGQLKQTGQSLRLDSEGGGSCSFEFDEGAVDAWVGLRRASLGKPLRILIEVEP